MKKKKLINPRGYLSWTQISLWLRSPELYKRHYFYGEDEYKNERMDFGSKVSTALETGEESDDVLVNMLITLLPKYSVPECEIQVPFMTPYGEVVLLGKMDTYRPEPVAFREYKTGTTKWTQKMAEGHKQLDHYTAILWLLSKKIPQCHLDWAETKVEDGVVTLAGPIKSFEVKKTVKSILQYLAIAGRVAKEIDEAYRKELGI